MDQDEMAMEAAIWPWLDEESMADPCQEPAGDFFDELSEWEEDEDDE